MAATKGMDWKKHRKRLGTLTDPELARELGVSKVQVHYKRKEWGIPAHFDNAKFWTPQRVAALGTNYDRYWADKWKVAVARVTQKSDVDWVLSRSRQRDKSSVAVPLLIIGCVLALVVLRSGPNNCRVDNSDDCAKMKLLSPRTS